MARSIVTAASVAASPRTRAAPGSEPGPAPLADDYSDALLKLIPAEVIGVYLSMQTMISSSTDAAKYVHEVVFLFGLFATYFYLNVVAKVKNKRQLGISVGAFCVWALAMHSGPGGWLNGTYAGLILLAFTFIAPKIPLDAGPAKAT